MVTLTTRAVAIPLAVLICGGLIAAGLLARRSTPLPPLATTASQPAASADRGFPVPPSGAVTYAREWGARVLALGVAPAGGGVVAEASIVGAQGTGLSGLRVALDGREAAPCGPGCYRARLDRRPAVVEVRTGGVDWRVALPSAWPPPSGTAIVRRAAAAWRALHSLSYEEHLASDATHSVDSTWRIEAPGNVSYVVRRGGAGVVVGDKRWDRVSPRSRWIESQQTPLTQPTPAWVGISDAHVLGVGALAGRRVWWVSFFDPRTPAWFKIAVDRSTYHTLETQMITTAHFMRDVYGRFNTTPSIVPPR